MASVCTPETSSSSDSRPLGSAEFVYWLSDQLACTNFVVLAELVAPITHEDLQRALDHVRKRHALLDCHVALDSHGRPAIVHGVRQACTVAVDSGDSAALRRHVESQLNTRFAFDERPLLRVVYWPNTAAPTLTVTFSHALTDAMPAALFVRDVVAAASGLPVPDNSPYDDIGPAVESRAPKRFCGVHGLTRLVRQSLRESLAGRGRYRPVQPSGVREPRDGARSPRMLSFRLEGDDLGRLLSACRREKVTVQAALCAAQLLSTRTEFDSDGPVPLAIQSAVGLRASMVPPVEADRFGMHVGLVPTTHRVGRDAHLWDLAREVRARLSTQVDRGRPFLLWRFFPPPGLFGTGRDGALKLEKLVRSQPPGSVVTNLGRIESRGALKSLQFAMAHARHETLCTCVCTTADCMVVNCVFNVDLVDQEYARRQASRIEAALREG